MTITFIGGGNMASAVIGGLLRKGWKSGAITVVEVAAPARAQLESRLKVKNAPAIDVAARDAACIVLAVKPQQMRAVALELAPLLREQLVVSIAAGIRLADL